MERPLYLEISQLRLKTKSDLLVGFIVLFKKSMVKLALQFLKFQSSSEDCRCSHTHIAYQKCLNTSERSKLCMILGEARPAVCAPSIFWSLNNHHSAFAWAAADAALPVISGQEVSFFPFTSSYFMIVFFPPLCLLSSHALYALRWSGY